ncbi:MAG: hypothetical protein OXE73_08420 [Gammaproteobacteria bacterium]|nr:hypothetical protein [Gammaproteobacteria bacterium]
MERITQLIRVGAALLLALALAVGYSTVGAGPVSATATAARDCDSDPYCFWTPIDDCVTEPCWTNANICCWP